MSPAGLSRRRGNVAAGLAVSETLRKRVGGHSLRRILSGSETERETMDQKETGWCVGCQQEADPADLERFVYHESVGLVFDMRGGAPGREAYAHPMAGCLKAAAWAGFSRALETPLDDLEGDQLVDDVRQGLRRRLAEQIGEASRQQSLRAGRRAVEKASAEGDLELVLLDAAAGDSISRDVARIGEKTEAHVFDGLSEGLVEEALGRKVVVAGIAPGRHAERIGRTIEKILCVEYESG